MMGSTTAMDDTHPFVRGFAQFESALGHNGLSWLHRLRSQGIERFADTGFPTVHDEEWKYTSVAPIAATAFQPLRAKPARPLRRDDVAPFSFAGLEATQLVFVDGRYAPGLSTHRPLPTGVQARGLAQTLQKDPDVVKAHLGRYAKPDAQAFTALNTAYVEDGAFVQVPPRVVVLEPIHLLFVSTGGPAPSARHPRNLILLGEQSQASVIETYAGVGSGAGLTNAVTEVAIGPGAILDHVKIQRETESWFHVATMEVHQERDSRFTSHSIALGGGLVRNDLNTVFLGEGGDCQLNGLYALAGTQHVDNHTKIDHTQPHCTSREFYKGILDGKSRGIFYGKIFVRKNAQKTDASQTNKNLVLSEGALADSTPALEINNNDVKCSHASTIGQLDKDGLFYLRSRGIDVASARSILTYAFARDVLARVKLDPVRAHLEGLLITRLPNGRIVQESL